MSQRIRRMGSRCLEFILQCAAWEFAQWLLTAVLAATAAECSHLAQEVRAEHSPDVHLMLTQAAEYRGDA